MNWSNSLKTLSLESVISNPIISSISRPEPIWSQVPPQSDFPPNVWKHKKVEHSLICVAIFAFLDFSCKPLSSDLLQALHCQTHGVGGQGTDPGKLMKMRKIYKKNGETFWEAKALKVHTKGQLPCGVCRFVRFLASSGIPSHIGKVIKAGSWRVFKR